MALRFDRIEITGTSTSESTPSITNSSGELVRFQTSSGYIDIGANNTGYAHFYTDRGKFYFSKKLIVDEGMISAYNEDLTLAVNDGANAAITIDKDSPYNVGIGTTTPSEKLNVDGNILATGTILGSNLSGTNTGDQDLSGYALTSHNHNIWDLTSTRSVINIDTVGNNNFWDYLHGTQTGDGTHAGSYQYVVSFGDESHGIQFSHTYGTASNNLYFRAGSDNPSSENGANTYKNWRRVLTTSDEGSGNGLDADTLDGQEAAAFALTGHNHDSDYVNVTGDTMTGQLEIALASNQLKLSTGTAGDGYLNIGHFSNGTFIGTYGDDGGAADLIRFGTHSGDERMRIASNGNVGIGETDPDTLLHITGDSPTIKLEDNVAGNYYNPKIEFYGFSEGGTLEYLSNPVFSGMRLHYRNSSLNDDTFLNLKNGLCELQSAGYTGGVTLKTDGVLQVNGSNDSYFSNGNVGIGTTSPNEVLHVSRASSGTGLLLENSVGGSGSYVTLDFNTYNVDQANFANYGASIRVIDDGAYSGDITFRTKGNAINAAQSEKMRIDGATGNVGIGTTSPGKLLELKGGDNEAVLRLFNDQANTWDIQNSTLGKLDFIRGGSNTYMRIDQFGNVGIGTTSPGEKLSVAPGTDASGEFGQAHVGMVGYAGYAGFSHVDRNSGGNYALLQHSNGLTYLNASAGQAIRFRIDNSDKMILDSSGRVGIGTTGPSEKLHVYNGSAYITPIVYAANQNDWVIRAGAYNNTAFDQGLKLKSTSGGASYMAFETTTGETMVLRGNNVGIGTDNPGAKLHVGNGTADDAARVYFSDNTYAEVRGYGMQFSRGASYLRPTTDKNKSLNIGSDGQTWSQVRVNTNEFTIEKDTSTFVKVDSSGNVGIGTTSPGYKLDVSGTIRATGDVIAFSDIRVKENIKTIDNALNKVKALRGVEYNKIDNPEKSIGVIAQEIEEVIPEVVREDDQGMKSVAYGNITAVLIEAIKEQQNQIDELKSIINASTK